MQGYMQLAQGPYMATPSSILLGFNLSSIQKETATPLGALSFARVPDVCGHVLQGHCSSIWDIKMAFSQIRGRFKIHTQIYDAPD